MQIVTNEFQFTKKDFFQLLFVNAMKRGIWITLVFAILTVQELVSKGLTKAAIMVGAFTLFYPAYLALSSWLYATQRKHNELLFRERYYKINDQELTVYFKNGPSEKIGFDKIIKAKKGIRYYELYLNKKNLIQLPYTAFQDEKQAQEFESVLRAKKLLA